MKSFGLKSQSVNEIVSESPLHLLKSREETAAAITMILNRWVITSLAGWIWVRSVQEKRAIWPQKRQNGPNTYFSANAPILGPLICLFSRWLDCRTWGLKRLGVQANRRISQEKGLFPLFRCCSWPWEKSKKNWKRVRKADFSRFPGSKGRHLLSTHPVLSFLGFPVYQGKTLKFTKDFCPLPNPSKPWKTQRKRTNSQGNSLLKLLEGPTCKPRHAASLARTPTHKRFPHSTVYECWKSFFSTR